MPGKEEEREDSEVGRREGGEVYNSCYYTYIPHDTIQDCTCTCVELHLKYYTYLGIYVHVERETERGVKGKGRELGD